MESFKKIKEDDFYQEGFNLEKAVIPEVFSRINLNIDNYKQRIENSVIECESPIEQLLSIEMEKLNFKEIFMYNPFVDILEIEKQAKIKCGNKTYRADFLIPVVYYCSNGDFEKGINFIIECDGYEFHQKTKEQVEKDNERHRNLQKAGYEIIRFSGTEIWHKPYRCACEILKIILLKCNYGR